MTVMKKCSLCGFVAAFLMFCAELVCAAQESYVPYIPEDEMPDVVQCIPAPPQDPSTDFDHDILRYMWGKQQQRLHAPSHGSKGCYLEHGHNPGHPW